MRRSRFGRIAEGVTNNPLARKVLGTVVDHTIEQGVAHFKEQIDGMLGVLQDEGLLIREIGEDTVSEALLLELGEYHRKMGAELLLQIEGTDSYREMVHAVIDCFEKCQEHERRDDIEARIVALEDPLARAFIRAFLFERDHVLEFLNFLKREGIDHLDGKQLVRYAPDILNKVRFSQSDLLREVIRAEPNGVVSRGLLAFFGLKHAGRE